VQLHAKAKPGREAVPPKHRIGGEGLPQTRHRHR
jgi:hypothetical protein